MQNSSPEEVSALVGNNIFHCSKLQNHYTEAAVVECRFVDDHGITSYPPTDTSSETKFSTDKSDQKVLSRTDISNKSTELDNGQYRSIVVQISKIMDSSTSINGDMHCDVTLESGMEHLRSFVDNNGSPPSNHKNLDVQYSGSDISNDENLVSQESVVAEKSWSNEALNTSLEVSSANSVAGQDVSTGTVGCLKKPFQFLIKMPRFDDEKLREHIRLAQLQVDEKTRSRDAIWQEIKKKRDNCQHYGVEFEAAKSEERAARRQVRSKRAEIEHLQTEINRVKNAISIEEIDARICSMECMIEHETLPLKEEKNLNREIKQLKQLRDQLSTNIGSCVEVQQALDNRSQIEENLKILKKELDSLKNKVSKAEAVALAVSWQYEEESKMHKELRALYNAANESRQAAYEDLQVLRKTLYEKNKYFRMYKDATTTANSHAACQETEALHHLCSNQVEKYMELWNRDEKFRKEYVRCNMRSTIRRLGTLDGRSLGLEESPPVLPVYVVGRTNKLGSSTSVDLISPNLLSPQEDLVLIKDNEDTTRNPLLKVAGQKAEQDRKKEPVMSNLENVEHIQTEELEAWKDDALGKLETAVRQREQCRLEEIIKAKEALERKKRNAEKAQVRAELRAQKEAEQREKEKEKRLRKKGRKKGSIGEAGNENESASICETTIKDTMIENESKESKDEFGRKSQRAPQCTKQSKTKSIPPPLRNKSKRRMQQWVRIIFTSFAVIVLFLLGNIGFFASLKQRQNVS
ncbi:unnamed protein product [Cuscuta campestris]|uniref:Proton pump-interactor 1 n=1 Tax=Cuscuta campestris TaxID=132261 RepID=A0A484N3Q8_9ASTE|nr:unnamed protein product [Cuscuta campestris]